VRIAKRGLTALAEAGIANALGDSWADRLDDLEWLVDERRFQEAIPRLEAYHRGAKASRQHARALRARELLARSFRETDHPEAALEIYDELAALGRHPTAAHNIVHLHAKNGDMKAAERHLLESHAKRKTRAYWRDLGHLRMEFGQYKEAEKALRRAVAGRSRRSTQALWQDITWCAVRTGQTERALKLLEQIATRQPKRTVWASYWQARTLQDAGRLKEAKRRFHRLQEQDPFSYYGLMAWSRLQDIEQMPLVAEQSPGEQRRSDDGPTAQFPESEDSPPAPPVMPPFQQVPEVPRAYPPLSPPVALQPPTPSKSPEPGTLLASLGTIALAAGHAEIGPTLEDAGLDPEVRGTLGWPIHMRSLKPDMAFLPASREKRIERLEHLAKTWGKVVPHAQRALELERLGFTELATDELRVVETDV
ncbi:MAG: tetratricopeptide repeat protein, partial [Myxococcota bacterium]|nr:tetratricopeptide repeat protein [Myxococcota bacterium]